MIKTKIYIPDLGANFEVEYVSAIKPTGQTCPTCQTPVVYEQLVDIDQITNLATDAYVETTSFDGQFVAHKLALTLMGSRGHCIHPNCLHGYRCEAPAKY